MKIYTKIELEKKIQSYWDDYNNPLMHNIKDAIDQNIKYYTNKLIELDKTPNLKTIKA